jgi:hypothetical protein
MSGYKRGDIERPTTTGYQLPIYYYQVLVWASASKEQIIGMIIVVDERARRFLVEVCTQTTEVLIQPRAYFEDFVGDGLATSGKERLPRLLEDRRGLFDRDKRTQRTPRLLFKQRMLPPDCVKDGECMDAKVNFGHGAACNSIAITCRCEVLQEQQCCAIGGIKRAEVAVRGAQATLTGQLLVEAHFALVETHAMYKSTVLGVER